jgi:hypothetical protein
LLVTVVLERRVPLAGAQELRNHAKAKVYYEDLAGVASRASPHNRRRLYLN